jgi:hypothetical protein
MIPKLAIEKAIEGGWQSPVHLVSETDESGRIVILSGYPEKVSVVWKHAEIALDPSFWLAFGKTLGWKHQCVCGGYNARGGLSATKRAIA